MNWNSAVVRVLPRLFILTAVLVWVAIFLVLPTSTAIRAFFLVFAVLISIPVFFLTVPAHQTAVMQTAHTHATYAKIVTALGALALCLTVWLGTRFVPLLLFLMTGYFLVAYQLSQDAPPVVLVYEIMLLYFIPMIAKYITTGLYFGNRDPLTHAYAIDQLLATGALSMMPTAYTYYPVYHLLTGGMSAIFGLLPYDALVLTGVLVQSLVIPVVYMTISSLFDDNQIGLGSTIGMSILVIPAFYAIAFFPQTLAVVQLFIGFYLYVRIFRAENIEYIRRYMILFILLVILMTITHHLTYILFLIPLGLATALLGVRFLIDFVRPSSEQATPRCMRYLYSFPIFVSIVILLSAWLYSPSIFLRRVARGAMEFLFLAAEGGLPSKHFGLEPLQPGVSTAIQWLYTPSGVYYSFFGATLVVAVYEFIQNVERYWDWIPLLGTGFALSIILFPIPFSVPWLDRFRFVFCIIVVVPLGIGIARITSFDPKHRRYALVLLVFIAIIGGSAVFTSNVSSDIEFLHTEDRSVEMQIDEQEYRMLQGSAEFLTERSTTSVSSGSLEGGILRMESDLQLERVEVYGQGVKAPPGLLVTRNAWTENEQSAEGIFMISKDRFASVEQSHNKIYTTGQVHMHWSEQTYRYLYGDDPEQANSSLRRPPPEEESELRAR